MLHSCIVETNKSKNPWRNSSLFIALLVEVADFTDKSSTGP